VKSGMWCTVSQHRIICSVFFEETVDAEHLSQHPNAVSLLC